MPDVPCLSEKKTITSTRSVQPMDLPGFAEVAAVVDCFHTLHTGLAPAEGMSVVVREGAGLEVVEVEYILVAQTAG